MNVQFVLIHAALFLFLFPPGTAEQPPADTLKIKTAGAGNYIRIDSAWVSYTALDTVIVAGATGEINQTGKNNRVEINTGLEAPNSKKQNTNKFQNSKSKNQITIKQTGKNNSVKINSR